jgi:hypothetical protein
MAKLAWDIGGAAVSMPRFSFIAEFVLRATSKATGRSVTNGFRVMKHLGRYSYTIGHGVPAMPWSDAGALYDAIRRTPLNYFVRQAEDLRVEAHA